MNAHQRRKAIRARTHAHCDNCGRLKVWRSAYYALTGCRDCWGARAQRQRERAPLGWMGLRPGEEP